MRIVGGRFRGRRLAEVGTGDEAARLRPTSDRVRESLFNLLAHRPEGDAVAAAVVLDVFAGTGALGLEALSRGARQAIFLENGRVALGLLRRNVAALGLGEAALVLPRDATRPGAPAAPPATLALLDPPYGRALAEAALEALAAAGWLAPDAIAVVEESAPVAPPPDWTTLDARRYGSTQLTILARSSST